MALSVIAYFITGIGWIILVELLFEWWRTWHTPDSFNATRGLHDTALSLSPVLGPARPIDMLLGGEQYSRTPGWNAIGVMVLFKAAIAGVLLWLSIKTFDRCLGRVCVSRREAAIARARSGPIGPKPIGPDDLSLARTDDGFRA